jgi:hypothetical protein
MRIVDNQLGLLRPPEMTADRAAALRQTGLTTGTLNEMIRDTEDERQSVRDKPEVEGAIVRTDAESESAPEQEAPEKKANEAPPSDEDAELRRRASERLLNLPVSRGKEPEERRFDIKV